MKFLFPQTCHKLIFEAPQSNLSELINYHQFCFGFQHDAIVLILNYEMKTWERKDKSEKKKEEEKGKGKGRGRRENRGD